MKWFLLPPYCFPISDETVDHSVFSEQKCRVIDAQYPISIISFHRVTHKLYFNTLLIPRGSQKENVNNQLFLKSSFSKSESNFFHILYSF